MNKTQLRNLWANRKDIWQAMALIGESKFEPHHAGWHHWVFQQGKVYKDGALAPDDITLEMWIKNPSDKTKYAPTPPSPISRKGQT